jgi:cadmium resistance protein CadD (predicted permease)
VNHPLVASRIRHIGNIILPFVLIGLGIYILTESFLLEWMTIILQISKTLSRKVNLM